MTDTPPSSGTAPETPRPRVVYIEDFGGWFKMTPQSWAEMVYAAQSLNAEWDVRTHGGRVLRNRPRCVRFRLMDTTGGRWWEWSAPADVALAHPRDDERNNWYWQQQAERVVAWGLGYFTRCGLCDECMESPDEPCEWPVLNLGERK